MASALELTDVSAGYGETVVLEDINLVLAPGADVRDIRLDFDGVSVRLDTLADGRWGADHLAGRGHRHGAHPRG